MATSNPRRSQPGPNPHGLNAIRFEGTTGLARLMTPNALTAQATGRRAPIPDALRMPLKNLLDGNAQSTLPWIPPIPWAEASSEDLVLGSCDDLLFGAVSLPADRIEQATQMAYERMTQALSAHPGFHLIRLWNFLPAINEAEDGLERYRRFSRARHNVFERAGYRMTDDLPAASAVGSPGDHLVVHFLAGNGRVTPIENPLQVSAYRYPTQYGPRSPSFSRAVIHESATGRQFLISGTSSILGHETIAPHDPLTQTRITLDNLEALLQAANYPRLAALGQKASWCVYLRNPSDLDTVRPLIDARLPRDSEVIYLEGDICRRDLVIEIEGTLLC